LAPAVRADTDSSIPHLQSYSVGSMFRCRFVLLVVAILVKVRASKDDDLDLDEDSKDEDLELEDEDKDDDGGSTAQIEFTHTWNDAAITRGYSMVQPSASCSSQGMAVILDPDGTGSCGTWSSLADSLCILVVCPLSTGGWQATAPDGDSEDVEFIAELVQSLQAEHSTPADKVIITGFSFGGTMSYRVWCERPDVVTGMVAMGQTFFEPATGHNSKDDEVAGQTETETALQRMTAARDAGDGCVPADKRPHYAVVGTSDEYYAEDGGVYVGRSLWEFMSTEVLGCTGSPTGSDGSAITGDPSTCFEYPSCVGLTASLNRYCTVTDRGHETGDWSATLATAFADFYGAPPPTPAPPQTPAPPPTPAPAPTPAPIPTPDDIVDAATSTMLARGILVNVLVALHAALSTAL